MAPSARACASSSGSGTGIATPWLAERFALVMAAELSPEMLKLAPAGVGSRLRADGSQLPLRDQSVDAAVLVNMFLFPEEMARVVRPDGVVVWVNTSGDRTPIHLTADEVDDRPAGRVGGRRLRSRLGHLGRPPPRLTLLERHRSASDARRPSS